MSPGANSRSNRKATLLALTFIVSFCSFAYEFVFSEELKVMYGGTVAQYTVTIGIYFFALGIGAALVDDLDTDRYENFTRIELYLALVATLGFVGILVMNSVALPAWVPYWLEMVVARGPPMVVGFLSGFEFPFLTHMVNEEDDGGDLLPEWLAGAFGVLHGAIYRVLGLFFHTDRTDARTGLSLTLAMDYLGGLVGALVYAKVLYPKLGLIPTIFILGLLNTVAALLFVARFSDHSPLGRVRREADRRPIVSRERTSVVVALLLVTAALGGVAAHPDRVNDELSGMYLSHQFESEYVPTGADPGDTTMQIDVTDHRTTPYQTLTEYERAWNGTGANPYFNGTSETCLRMGSAVQMCESWADSYHDGLVDVPMAMFENESQTDVLLIGGGDHVALNHLRNYNVSVTRVDLDGEFMEYARTDPLFARYHDDAYEYPNQTTIVGDGYSFLQQTDEKYDIIMLDIPGATDDDMLKLYSEEFYRGLRGHLAPGGVVATWGYNPGGYSQHHKTYLNTVAAAGFENQLRYWALEDLDGDSATERVERFYLFAPDARQGSVPVEQGDHYVRRYDDRYSDMEWREIPTFSGVEPNSIFDPNYDVIIE